MLLGRRYVRGDIILALVEMDFEPASFSLEAYLPRRVKRAAFVKVALQSKTVTGLSVDLSHA